MVVSHLRNASLTLCPRRSKFRLSMQSLPVMMCSNSGKSVCYVVVPFVCDFHLSVFHGSQRSF